MRYTKNQVVDLVGLFGSFDLYICESDRGHRCSFFSDCSEAIKHLASIKPGAVYRACCHLDDGSLSWRRVGSYFSL